MWSEWLNGVVDQGGANLHNYNVVYDERGICNFFDNNNLYEINLGLVLSN